MDGGKKKDIPSGTGGIVPPGYAVSGMVISPGADHIRNSFFLFPVEREQRAI
jgi:hypothetical protein